MNQTCWSNFLGKERREKLIFFLSPFPDPAATLKKVAEDAFNAAKAAEDHRVLAEEAQKAADAKAAADRDAKLEEAHQAAKKQAEEAAAAAAAAAEAARKAAEAQAQAEEALRRNRAAAEAAARASDLERAAAEARKQAGQVQDAALDPSKPMPESSPAPGAPAAPAPGPDGVVPFPHEGWLAQLDPRSGRYYFVDRSQNPPLITWVSLVFQRSGSRQSVSCLSSSLRSLLT